MGVYVAIAIALVVSSIGLSRLIGSSEGVERVIVIPAGTAARVADGEEVEIIPDDLRFELRDRLVVVNNDSTTHTVGPFTVPAGQRLEKRFSEAASFDGFCSLHPSGDIRIEIGDA
jgi:hypothetical protein